MELSERMRNANLVEEFPYPDGNPKHQQYTAFLEEVAQLGADLFESTSTSVQLGMRLEEVKSVVAQLEERVRELEADIDHEETLDHQQTISDARHAGCP